MGVNQNQYSVLKINHDTEFFNNKYLLTKVTRKWTINQFLRFTVIGNTNRKTK